MTGDQQSTKEHKRYVKVVCEEYQWGGMAVQMGVVGSEENVKSETPRAAHPTRDGTHYPLFNHGLFDLISPGKRNFVIASANLLKIWTQII